MKKIMSLLLAIVMVIGICPTFAFAEADEDLCRYIPNGTTITFGSYPQSKVTDSTLTTALTSKAGSTSNWTSYRYYINSSQGDFMKYKDVEYNGEKYRGVYFTYYRPYETSYSCYTDNSNQEDNGYYTSNIYWFKYEPVTWTVLDEEAGLVVSNLVLDSQDYYNSISIRTIDGKTVYTNNWEYSNIRKWLNDNFYNTAFSSTEQNAINTTTLENKAYRTDYSQYDANNTGDKVFCLTYADAYKYWSNSTDRRAKNTDYAKCQGAYNNTSYGTSPYWLRSAGSYNYYACHVYSDGGVYYDYVDNTYGVRPALFLNLSSSIFESYNGKKRHNYVSTAIAVNKECSKAYKKEMCSRCGKIKYGDEVAVPDFSVSCKSATMTVNVGEPTKLATTITPVTVICEGLTYKSYDETVATVDESGNITGKKPGTTVIMVSAANGSIDTCVVTVKAPAKSISLKSSTMKLNKGDIKALEYTVNPTFTTDSFTWTSSDTSVATVDSTGKITAKHSGATDIKITATSGVSATCKLTVVSPKPITAFSFNSDIVSVEKGTTKTLDCSITPADTTDDVVWTSSDSSVATVADGVVTAKAVGTTTITATTEGGIVKTCTVKVIIAAKSVQLSKTSAIVNKFDTFTLTATLTPSNTTDTIKWVSSNPSVAVVTATGKVTAVGGGTAVISAVADNGAKAECTVKVVVNATAISLSQTSARVIKDRTLTLSKELTPSDSTNIITWSSSDETIATVDQNGVVTAKSVGNATITAKTDNGLSATCEITVFYTPATNISINKTALEIDIGKTAATAYTITPADSTDYVKYSSSDASVASVNDKGVITANKKGTATITITTESGKTATCKVTVLVPATSISVCSDKLTIENGEKAEITATIFPSDSTDTISWASSDSNVAVVSDGTITAVGCGTATITAKTSGGKTATCVVTVPYHTDKVTLDKTSLILDITKTATLTATQTPSQTVDVLSFTSSDTKVATVDNNGKVTAVSRGNATITAQSPNGKTATCEVTVLVPITRIELSSTSIEMTLDEVKDITATMYPSNTTDTFVWKSSDESIVSIENGTITAVGKGRAYITVETSRGVSATCMVLIPIPAESIKTDRNEIVLYVNESATINATVAPANTTDSVSWKSSDSGVVTVDNNGKITAKVRGTAVITAEINGFIVETKVTVLVPASAITLDVTDKIINVNDNFTLKSTLAPSNTTDSITFTSSDNKIATVDSDGKVTAKAKGSVTITAKTTSGKTATCKVTVKIPVSAVMLDKTTIDLNVAGQYIQLTANVSPDTADDKSVKWSSDNTKIATVDSNGKVTVVGFGLVKITATTVDGGKTAACTINVNGIKYGDINLDGNVTVADARLALRQAIKLENYAADSDPFKAADVDIDGSVTVNDARRILRGAIGLDKLPEGGGHYHLYNETTKTIAPTCTEQGYVAHTCFICGYIDKTDIKAALGHKANAATCTAASVCSVCKATVQKALGHKYSSATCTSPAKCTRCGATSSSALGHNYTVATCTEDGKCTRCGDILVYALGHNYASATCTSPAKCNRCGATKGSALGHKYSSATCTSPAKCSRCGSTGTAALGHNYTSSVVAPTISTGGYTIHKCTRCGISYNDSYTDSTFDTSFTKLKTWVQSNGLYVGNGYKYVFYTDDEYKYTISYFPSGDFISFEYESLKDSTTKGWVSFDNTPPDFSSKNAVDKPGGYGRVNNSWVFFYFTEASMVVVDYDGSSLNKTNNINFVLSKYKDIRRQYDLKLRDKTGVNISNIGYW